MISKIMFNKINHICVTNIPFRHYRFYSMVFMVLPGIWER